jgi:hypothetical protein
MEQGSLADHLFPPDDTSVGPSKDARFLDWPTREKIALGAAKGLAHLHDVSRPLESHSLEVLE